MVPGSALSLSSLLCLLALGCSGNPSHSKAGNDVGQGPLPAGDHEFTIRSGGAFRSYLVRVPGHASTAGKLPVVLAFHGGGGQAEQFKTGSGLDAVADREGFLAVYPNGSGPLRNRLLTWNAGDCCGAAQEDKVDDVGFALAVVDDLARRTPVDLDRVFATGHSNGGMMSYRLAAEAGHRIAAIAPVGGAMIVEGFRPPRQVPVLHIHSVDDPRALYAGGEGPPFPMPIRTVFHRPVMEGLDAWIATNGCPLDPETVERIRGEPGTRNTGQTASHQIWAPCESGSPVEHWRLTGVGHGWPGDLKTRLRESIIGPSTTIISAAEEVWAFFSRFSLPGGR